MSFDIFEAGRFDDEAWTLASQHLHLVGGLPPKRRRTSQPKQTKRRQSPTPLVVQRTLRIETNSAAEIIGSAAMALFGEKLLGQVASDCRLSLVDTLMPQTSFASVFAVLADAGRLQHVLQKNNVPPRSSRLSDGRQTSTKLFEKLYLLVSWAQILSAR